MMKRVISIIGTLLAIFSANTSAQIMTFPTSSLKCNQLGSRGRHMIQLNYSFTFSGIQDKIVPYMVICSDDGNVHHFSDGREMIVEGNEIVTNGALKEIDTWQAIYVDALNPLPGRHTYTAFVAIYDATTQQWVRKGDPHTFDCDGNTIIWKDIEFTQEDIQDYRWTKDGNTILLPARVFSEPPAVSKNYVRSKASIGDEEPKVKYSNFFRKSYAGVEYTFGIVSPSEVSITAVNDGWGQSSIEMPSMISDKGKTYTVTGLGDRCMQMKQATKIILPQYLKRIGYYAFLGCHFDNFVIPSTVTRIDAKAFAECNQLTEITIPASVIHIGYAPFYKCSKMKRINVAQDNPKYKSISGILYNKECTELIQIPSGVVWDTYLSPKTLVSVNREAICTQHVSNFLFSNGLRYISKYAFNGSNINSIVIPASVLSIDEEAFTGSDRPNSGGMEGEYIGTMIVTSIRPKKMHINAFGRGYFKNNPTLYVPVGSRENYISSDGWGDLKDVQEVTFKQYE